jgi:hypothetical protein
VCDRKLDNPIDSSITLTQSGLIKYIIEALDIGDLPEKKTPASSIHLVKDEAGEPSEGMFSYSSVVGMLQYLQNHTRPDITYAVRQCARFVHSSTRSHELGLIRNGLYLKGTINQGLTFGRMEIELLC